jgi:predicted lipoprotein
MLGSVVDTVILPVHLALTADATALDQLARQFAAEPAPETLATLRSQWLATELAWKRVELYEFPGMLLIHNAIERRPARISFIEGAIAEADDEAIQQINADFVESLGSTSKGLAAIEYLIFPSESNPLVVVDSFGDPARGAYLTALTSNLVRKTEELRGLWLPSGENYALVFRENNSEGADLHGSISLLANEMIEMQEIVLRTKLGMPMGQTTDGVPQPRDVESYLSSASRKMMIANVESLRDTFEAGIDDYVDYLQRGGSEERLSDAIRAQFGAVLSTLNAIDQPLQTAITALPEEVNAVYEAMLDLLVLLKTDMAGVLGITVTFSDSDGD